MRDHTNTYLEPLRREIEVKENLVKVYIDRINSIPISVDLDSNKLEKNLAERQRLYDEKTLIEIDIQRLRRKEFIFVNPTFVLMVGKLALNEVTDSFPMLSTIQMDAEQTIDEEIRKAVYNQGLILQKGEYIAIAVRRAFYKTQIIKVPDLMGNDNLYVSSKAFTFDGKYVTIK